MCTFKVKKPASKRNAQINMRINVTEYVVIQNVDVGNNDHEVTA